MTSRSGRSLLIDAEQSPDVNERKLKNIIFLPFNKKWELFVSITILLNFMFNIFIITYDIRVTIKWWIFYYVCEIIFFINTCALVLHRVFTLVRKTRHHRKKNSFLIGICLLTVLPVQEGYYMISAFTWSTEKEPSVERFIGFKCCLRIIYAMVYFNQVKNQVGKNDLFFVLYTHIFIGICVTAIGTCAWHISYNFSGDTSSTWRDRLQFLYIDPNVANHMLAIGYHTNVAFFTGSSNGVIYGENNYEKILIIIMMSIGFIYQHVVLAGELLATFLRKQRHKFTFSSQLKKIIHLLDDWRVKRDVKRQTIDYYKVYWERRSGIGSMPSAFNLLPFSLRKEITVDIYWEAFRHSKIFSELDTPFKRSLSLKMKSEFYLSGDYLYRVGEPKNKMIYILSGTVQILSEEDHDTPVLNLCGGTILGELSCLTIHKSRVNVRCNTYCEIQSLDIRSFYSVLMEYRRLNEKFTKEELKRIDYARWALSDDVPKVDYTKTTLPINLPTLTKLKRQWNLLMKMHKSKRPQEQLWLKLDKSFTSNHLDALVICDTQESDEHKICIKDTCPVIMREESSFRNFLENLVLLAVFFELLIIPYSIFFRREITYFTWVVMVPIDLIYYFDIFVQLSTTIKVSPEVTLTQSKDIILYRFKQVGFYIDILAGIPLHAGFLLVGIEKRTALIAYCFRILKAKKIYAKIYKLEKQLFLHILTVNSIKYTTMTIIFTYIFCCILYAIACYYPECVEESWYKISSTLSEFKESILFEIVYFFSVSLVLNYHVTDYLLATVNEIIIHIIIILIAYTIHSFMYAEMTSSAWMSYKEGLEHQDETAMFKIIVKKRNVGQELKMRLLNILEFHWVFNQGAEIIGANGILKEASEKIRSDVISDRMIHCLQKVPLFKNCPPTLLSKLAMAAEVVVLPPDTYIQNVDVMSHNIYVVLRGYCQMMSKLPGDNERNAKIILKHGDMLAVIETLHRVRMFGLITTVTAVELLSVSYDNFVDIFQSFQTEDLILQNALDGHMETFQTILMRKGCRLPEMRAPGVALGKVETFSFKVIMGKRHKSHLKDEYMKPFLLLGRWKWIRFFLMKSTINPSGLKYKIYETCRCCFILFDIFTIICSLSILSTNVTLIQILVSFGHVFGCIDQYIRMHCQYYNQKGILVTHPLHTLYYYLSTAFITDLTANLPLNLIHIRDFFHNNKYETELLIILAIRCLSLYRPYKGLSYLQHRYSWSGFILRLKIIMVIVIIISIFSIALMSVACEFHENGITSCTGGSFRIHSIFNGYTSPSQVFVQTLYITTTMYCQRTIDLFYYTHEDDITKFIILLLLCQIIRMILLAIYTSAGIGGNVNLSNHQARMRQFLTFAKSVDLDENITEEMVNHYEYVWRETLGTNITALSKKFNLYLRTQFFSFLYEETLRRTNIFCNAPDAIVQHFLPMLEEQHYKKGAEIIRCNDVQGKMFIVHRGAINITVANTEICEMEMGGIFGCFQKGGITRQTINVTAKSHTIVLTVDSVKFHELMSEWDDRNIETFLKQLKVIHTEFIEVSSKVTQRLLTREKLQVLPFEDVTIYDPIIATVSKYIEEDSKSFRIFVYILNVHIASISSVGFLAYAFIDAGKSPHFTFYIVLYLLDLLFFIKIFFGFHLPFVDLITGFKVLNAKIIAKRYAKKNFVVDMASLFPFEIISWNLYPNWIKVFTLNRTLRILYLYRYYQSCINKLTVSVHLRWSFLVYSTLFKLQFMHSIWVVVACLNPRCYETSNVIGRPNGTVIASDVTSSTILGYTYIINLFTKNGLKDSIPTSTLQLLITAIIAIYSHIIVAHLTSSYANITIIENNTMDRYYYKINHIKLYLKGRQLSPAIFKKVWEYFLELWNLQHGEWMPYLIALAPPYLKQDVMYYLYGHHLENHFLFAKTHKDFLRQVAALLERRIYLPGNVIVEKGDVDHTMYFLHNGEVGAYDKPGMNELTFILTREMAFGEAQGMYGIPFPVSYKALSTTTILALQKHSWEYLLEWFPASNEEIMAKANEYKLKSGIHYYTKKL
ncbi:uncharacterized protein [Onthophagus taurus]|uniref:uncharacterized protein n=1 Tax=Onthophagus taurus TaxID=166361 RepID=UPI0039BDCAD2